MFQTDMVDENEMNIFCQNTLLILNRFWDKKTKINYFSVSSHNLRTAELISVKFYIGGPCTDLSIHWWPSITACNVVQMF
jgi:hypothetical protein